MAREKTNEKGTSAIDRRRFIFDQVSLYGKVTFKEIEAEGYKTGWQSLKGDEKFFQKLNLGIRLESGEGIFILTSRDIVSIYDYRSRIEAVKKKAIGNLAGSLLWGTELYLEKSESSNKDQIGTYTEQVHQQLLSLSCYTKKDLIKYAKEESIDISRKELDEIFGPDDDFYVHEDLCMRILQYWRKQNRHCALDAGTTAAQVAESLAKKNAPDQKAGIASLTLLTNAPHIENILHKPKISTEVIVLGGYLRKDTAAHTGILTENCLNVWNIQLDITMVGTTSLTVDRIPGFTCDSPEEARTKALLLENANIRCILMDSSKCKRHRSSAFIFASLSSKFVDLVITDEGIIKNIDLLRLLKKAGISILVAKPPVKSQKKELKS